MKFFYMAVLAAVLGGCSGEQKREYDLWIGPAKVDCVGSFPQSCLLVRESPTGQWEYFYDQIEGFTWEPGYDYHIRVRETKIDNPPMDGSSLRYVLLRV